MLSGQGAPLRRGAPFAFLLLILIFLSALSPAAAAAEIRHDVAYGTDRAQRFDVYPPRLPPPEHPNGAPVLFLVHGGAWKIGDKDNSAVVADKVRHWTARGFVVVSTNYRLNVPPDQQAEDVAAAIAATRRLAPQWGADPQAFVLMGHSAGAHLVALLHVVAGPQAPWLGSVLLDSAAFDVAAIMADRPARFYRQAFGTSPTYWRQQSPLDRLTGPVKPVLAVCSTRRDDSCRQAQTFVDKVEKLASRATLLAVALSHRQINDDLGEDSAYTRAVDAFIDGLNGR